VTPPDNIVAVASPPGRGAVGIVRISGGETRRMAQELLGFVPAPRYARLADFLGADGASLDRGLALYFPAPASFTGEDVLELQGHGGTLVLDLLVRRALELGCRLARPGEFSERAFLNGKLDIAQAEAVADLIEASTAAVRSMRGEFSSRIAAIESQLIELRSYVEAAIDFPDEEIDFLASPAIASRLTQLFATFANVRDLARRGALLREGLSIVIAGRPNAGKSSLLNRLVGDDVAIVTPSPGTTRDVLRQHVQLDGLPLHLADTAGLRKATDDAEQEGIRRARSEMDKADRLLYVLDASLSQTLSPQQLEQELSELPAGIPVTLVLNKIDLVGMEPGASNATPPTISLSAHTGAGVALLRAHLKTVAGYQDAEAGALSARRRHLDALDRARTHVETAAEQLLEARSFELFAEELRLAQRALGEITGEFTNEDLLGAIFGSFCIGK
jgi:tRNA modification GTPase